MRHADSLREARQPHNAQSREVRSIELKGRPDVDQSTDCHEMPSFEEHGNLRRCLVQDTDLAGSPQDEAAGSESTG